MQRILAVLLFCVGLLCLAQAQVPMTGAGKGAPGGGGGPTVTLSATGTKVFSAAPTSPVSYSGITVGASDTTLVASISFDTTGTTTISAASAVWDLAGANQAMTKVADDVTIGTGSGSIIYCRQGPVSGNKVVTFSWTQSATTNTFTNAVSFTGSSTGCQNPQIGNSVATIAVTSGTGHVVVSAGTSGSSLGTLTSTGNTCPTGSPTCIIYSDSVSGSVVNVFAQLAAGAATVNVGSSAVINGQLGLDVAP